MPAFTLPADSDLSAVAIFNVRDTAYAGGMSPTSLGSQNQQALQAAVNTAQSAGGGAILIPAIGTYQINGTVTIGSNLSPPSAISLIFAGTGQGDAKLPTFLKVEDDGMTPDNTDLFFIDTGSASPGDDDVGGITFRDLQIQYIKGAAVQPNSTAAAINVAGGQNVRIERIVFADCPQSVVLTKSLQASVLECTATNDKNAGTVLTLGSNTEHDSNAEETHVENCLFRSNNATGIGVLMYSVLHLRMINVRIEGYEQGILITPGPNDGNIQRVHFDNISCFPNSDSASVGAALFIQPAGGQYVERIWFRKSEFAAPDQGTAYTGAGIVIDPVGGSGGGGLIDQIRFVDCYSCVWSGPGIDIIGGTNIEILGGYYSCNGVPSSPPSSLPLAGIAVTGAASSLRITGVACNNSVLFKGSFEPSTQEVGIYIAGDGASNLIIDHCDLTGNLQHGVLIAAGGVTVSNVFIRNCNASGYGTHPADAINVVGEVSNVQITNCAGYNDKAAVLSTSAPTGTFSNTSFGYYGPMAFYASMGTSPLGITIDGTLTGLTSGGFTLGPGETAAITGAPGKFLAVGK